jgi:hypothetical protein
MDTATENRPPASTGSPGGAPASNENAAAGVFTILGFALGGPLGGVLAAMAVGIERAFINSPWEQPSLPVRLSPEEREARRQQALAAAREHVAQSRARAQQRQAQWAEHRRAMREHLRNGGQGERPVRPGRRTPGEFAGDLARTSNNWYKLLDDKFARGNVKVNDFYDATGQLFGDLRNFVEDFWDGYHQERDRQRAAQEPEPVEQPEPEAAITDHPEQRSAPEEQTGRQPEPETEPLREEPNPGRPPQEPLGKEYTAWWSGEQRPGQHSGAEQAHSTKPEYSWGPERPGTTEPQVPQPMLPGQPSTEPAGSGGGALEGELMAADGSMVAPGGAQHMGPQGTTNLDLLFEAFSPAASLLNAVAEQVTVLNAEHVVIRARIARITALAGQRGVPIAVFHALAEAEAADAALQNGLGQIALHNEMARELTDTALAALQPVADDQDQVHSEGASGDLLDRAAA